MKLTTKRKTIQQFLKEYLHQRIIKYLTKNARHFPHDTNMAIYAKDFIGHYILLDGVYELEYLDVLMKFFKVNDVDTTTMNLLDIGANVGNHSIYFAQFFKSVNCFEPNSRLFPLLTLNTSNFKNITLHNIGISDHEGEAVLSFNEDNVGAGSITISNNQKQQVKIVLKTLDQLGINHPIHVIKIDIEGHEYEALKGGKSLITKNHPFIVFEQNEDQIENGTSKALELLKSYNYNTFYAITRKVYSTISKINLFAELLLGPTHEIKLITQLERKNYSMIIAVPNNYS